MRKSIAAAVIAASAATASCDHARSEEGGAIVTKSYQVGDFQKIEVAGPYDVEVRTGPKVSVSAQGGEKLLERTKVEVDGDTLQIGPAGHHGMFNFGWSSRGHAKFVVTVPALTGAQIAGSGDVKVDQVKGDSFEGSIAGSGGININALQVQTLKFDVAGSGRAKVASGTAQKGKFDIAGSGDIDAGNVDTKEIDLSIAGSGGFRGHSSGAAQISIMGSGDATITGGAKCQVSKMGSGNANCS
jgi:hypothetical protein